MKKEYLQKTIFALTVIGALTVLVLFISGIVHAVRWITAEPPQTKHISAGQAEQGVISEKTLNIFNTENRKRKAQRLINTHGQSET